MNATGLQTSGMPPSALPLGSCLLHIGPPKTGTTAVQGAFFEAREDLEAQAVLYAGHRRHPASAAQAAIGLHILHSEKPPPRVHWTMVLREIRASKASRIVLSSEFFAHADAVAIRRVVHELDPARLHVVVTLRPLMSILPSHWQQAVGRGKRQGFDAWLRASMRASADPTPGTFWHWQRHDLLVERWAAAVGPGRVHVVVVDPHDHRAVLRSFEALAGLREGTLPLVEYRQNRSLTLDEAELVREFNRAYHGAGLDMRAFDRLVPLGAVRLLKRRQPETDEPRVVVPASARPEIAMLQAGIVDRIRDLGIDVRGDLEVLLDRPSDVAPDPARPMLPVPGPAAAGAARVPVTVGAGFALALVEASGVARAPGRSSVLDILLGRAGEPGEVAAVPTGALAAVIVNRSIRSVLELLRAVTRRRPRKTGTPCVTGATMAAAGLAGLPVPRTRTAISPTARCRGGEARMGRGRRT